MTLNGRLFNSPHSSIYICNGTRILCECTILIGNSLLQSCSHSTEKGIPNVLSVRNNRTAQVNPAVLPSIEDAFQHLLVELLLNRIHLEMILWKAMHTCNKYVTKYPFSDTRTLIQFLMQLSMAMIHSFEKG